MNEDQLDAALRGFAHRIPFQPFWVEFTSGHRVKITHPEAIRRRGDLYAMRFPDGSNMVFAADSLVRLWDEAYINIQ